MDLARWPHPRSGKTAWSACWAGSTPTANERPSVFGAGRGAQGLEAGSERETERELRHRRLARHGTIPFLIPHRHGDFTETGGRHVVDPPVMAGQGGRAARPVDRVLRPRRAYGDGGEPPRLRNYPGAHQRKGGRAYVR